MAEHGDQAQSEKLQSMEQRIEELQSQLFSLKQLQFCCRYGDYAARICHGLRERARTSGNDVKGRLSGLRYWTEISTEIKEEEKAWEDTRDPRPREVRSPFTNAVWIESKHDHDDFKRDLQAIHLYAERNSLAHSNIDTLLQQRKNWELAQTLHKDLESLDEICPSGWSEQKALVRSLIEELIEKWFNKHGWDNEPRGWEGTPELYEEMRVASEKGEKKFLQAEKHAATAALAACTRNGEGEENQKLLAQLLSSERGRLPEGPGHTPFTPRKEKFVSKKESKKNIVHNTDALKQRALEIFNLSPDSVRVHAMKPFIHQLKEQNDNTRRHRNEFGSSDETAASTSTKVSDASGSVDLDFGPLYTEDTD